MNEKSVLYLTNGAANLWIVDIKQQALVAVSLQEGELQKRRVDTLELKFPTSVSIPAMQILDCSRV